MSTYYSQPTGRLENGHLILDYLLESGPRIVRLIPKGLGENLLAETPDVEMESPHGKLRLWGGHRLWRAPESAALSYVPDEGGLRIVNWRDRGQWKDRDQPGDENHRNDGGQPRDGGQRSERNQPNDRQKHSVTLTRDDPLTGIHKSLAITLAPDAPRVRLVHRLTNGSAEEVELAPWAITQMRLGGTAVLPTGDAADTAASAADNLLPNRLFALWPYSRWDDPRFRPGEEAIEIDTQAIADPFKLGYMNRAGWMAYRYGGVVFTKRWSPRPNEPHADLGCNAEAYANDRHLELETLGPLARLAPGEWVEHVEEWEVEG